MNNNNISIQDRTRLFATRAIKAYTQINQKYFDDGTRVLAEQFLRASISIGENLASVEWRTSQVDMELKYSMALKKAIETRYWIDIIIQSGTISEKKFIEIIDEINTIIRILTSNINILKKQQNRVKEYGRRYSNYP